jgi:glucose-specific phosphotransferase system IIA component
MVAALHNRFYKIELPAAVSYFAGVRFVPIICSVGAMVLGSVMSILWPVIQNGISFIGAVVMNSGHIGTFIFGFVERALIPFGLHHVFYIPFWQTGLGGSAIVDGIERFGSQGIYFAELASKNVEFFNLSATRFLTGKYPFMMAGLPASALAMYHCAKPEKRKLVGGLLMSAALTSFLTGITEPIEFTFLFIAPFLFIVHCGFAGLAFVITHVLKIAIGTTFSDGLIDFTLYGILQGNAKTNWLLMLPVFAGYFALYYFFFKFVILKWNLQTPGREEGEGEAKLYTRADYGAKKVKGKSKSAGTSNDTLSSLILRGLGGKRNIRSVDACATRLRLEVGNPALVQDDLLKQSGAKGVLKKGNGIQVIYGPQVTVIKSNFEEYLAEAEDAPLVGKVILASPLTGKIVPFSEVKDEAFSTGTMGQGIAILPETGTVLSPVNGVVDSVSDTKHAVNLVANNGLEILIHIGMDTVALKGAPFTPRVKEGDDVTVGTPLIDFDMKAIKAAGLDLVTPIALINSDEYNITFTSEKSVIQGDPLITAEKK